MKILREITDWNFPNHTYHINDKGKMVAYVKAGTEEIITFSKPLSFSRSRRKFETLAEIPESHGSDVERVEGSRGDVYLVNHREGTCTCPGFKFRRSCKHVKSL